MASMESQQISETYNNEHDRNDSSEDVLLSDLENALSSQFSFGGSFAHATKTAQAPNPCLNVEGVGLIGLPLSKRDVMPIAGCSIQLSHGHRTKALGKRPEKVRNTWEIEPQKVSFLNQDWEKFQSRAVKTVCGGLGVQIDQVQPLCELSKLILYEPGPHSLHQDPKSNGVFATMVVILPSIHTGGQVRVSHGTKSKMFDPSQNSFVSTSILGWYTDVPHESQPIVSGYRLALFYNLIHVSTTFPKPTVFQLDRLAHNLHEALRKWKEGAYQTLPKDSFVAYLLENQYSKQELLAGKASLKGADAHKVSFLRPIAEELGYTVCLGNLTYEISGVADDYNVRYKCRRDYFFGLGRYSETRSDDVSMGEVCETSMDISCLVNLDGVQILRDGLLVNNDSLVPENPFEGIKPDEKEYDDASDGSEYEGTLTLYYLRTVVVLIREQDTLNVLCSNRADGFDYGLIRLKESNNLCPTQTDKDIAYAMIKNLQSLHWSGYGSGDPANQKFQNVKIIIDYALRWDDVEMWVATMEQCVLGTQYLATCGTNLYIEAWDKFSFSKIEHHKVASSIISKMGQLRKCVDFIEAVRTHASEVSEIISEDWYKQKVIEALSNFKITSSSDDVDALLHVIATWGLQLVYENAIFPMSKKQGSFDFWLRLVQTMVNKKSTLCVPRVDGEDETSRRSHSDASSRLCPESEFNAVLNYCINIIAPQWSDIPSSSFGWERLHISKPIDQVQNEKINRIIQILDVCCLADCLEPCSLLLASVLEINPPTNTDILPSRFKSLYIPLVPKFVDILKKRDIALTLPPFDAFLRTLVQLYLQYILGTPRSLSEEVAKSQKIGCGKCTDCDELDRFMADINQKTIVFRINGPRRSHLEGFLSQAGGKRCDWSIVRDRSPHGLQVTKKDKYFARMTWERRSVAAMKFSQSFGDIVVLKTLMGPLWGDVSAAFRGVRPFVSNAHDHLYPSPHLLEPTMVPLPAQAPSHPIGPSNAVPAAQPPNPAPNSQAHGWHTQASNSLQRAHTSSEPLTPSMQIPSHSSHEAVQNPEEPCQPAKKRKRLCEPGADDVIDLTEDS